MKHRNRNNTKAFTLAELLVAVAIIAIIVAIGIIQLANARKNLQVKANDSNAKLIYLAAQNQMLQMKEYGQWGSLLKQEREEDETDGSDAGLSTNYFGCTLAEPGHGGFVLTGGSGDEDGPKGDDDGKGDDGPGPAPGPIWGLTSASGLFGGLFGGDGVNAAGSGGAGTQAVPDDGASGVSAQKPSDYLAFETNDVNAPRWTAVMEDMRVLEHFPTESGLYASGLLSRVLPLGTLEDDVRTRGKYIIEYDVETASVYGVFYTESDGALDYVSAGFRDKFYDVEGSAKNGRPYEMTGASVSEAAARRVRRDYTDINGNETILGYFGGSMAYGIDYSALELPEVRIDNGEELILNIKDPNSTSANRDETRVLITVTGKQSGGSVTYSIVQPAMHTGTGSGGYYLNSNAMGDRYLVKSCTEAEDSISYEIVLDSITPYEDGENSYNHHFAHNFGGVLPAPTLGMIPGEDIEVTVLVQPAASAERVALPVSRTVETNSLFATATVDTYGNTVTEASIAQLRHLENLSSAISGASFGDALAVTFEHSVSFDGQGSGLLPLVPKDYSDLENVQAITNVDGTATGFGSSTERSYVPVKLPNTDVTVTGNGCNVYNISINKNAAGGDNIGLFGTTGDLTISDLGIVSSETAANDASAPVKTVFRGNVLGMGAFAGNVSGTANLTECWSTVQLKSNDAQSGANIGGLLGNVSGAVTISNSYVSAATGDDGKYSMLPSAANLYVNANGRDVNAGGLVGNCASATLTDSYSLADVGFNTPWNASGVEYNIGGLAGHVQGAINIENSYYAGWMNVPVSLMPRSDTVNYGGFVGNCSSLTADDDSFWVKEFLGISNLPENSVNGDYSRMQSAAADTQSVDIETNPYDQTFYGDDFQYPDVTDLGHHWGDWCLDIPDIGLYIIPGVGINTLVPGNNRPTELQDWESDDSDTPYGTASIRFIDVPGGVLCDLEELVTTTLHTGFDGVAYRRNGDDPIQAYYAANPDTAVPDAPAGATLTDGHFYYVTTGKTAVILVLAERLSDISFSPADSKTGVFGFDTHTVSTSTNAYSVDHVTVRKFIAYAQNPGDLPDMQRTTNGISVKLTGETDYHEYAANNTYILEDISNTTSYTIDNEHHYGPMYYRLYYYAYCDEDPNPDNWIYSNLATDDFTFTLNRVPVVFHYTTHYAPYAHWGIRIGTSSTTADVTRYCEYGSNVIYEAALGTTSISNGQIVNGAGTSATVPVPTLEAYYDNAFNVGGWAKAAANATPAVPDTNNIIYNAIGASGMSTSHTWTDLSQVDLYAYWDKLTMSIALDPNGGYFETVQTQQAAPGSGN